MKRRKNKVYEVFGMLFCIFIMFMFIFIATSYEHELLHQAIYEYYGSETEIGFDIKGFYTYAEFTVREMQTDQYRDMMFLQAQVEIERSNQKNILYMTYIFTMFLFLFINYHKRK